MEERGAFDHDGGGDDPLAALLEKFQKLLSSIYFRGAAHADLWESAFQIARSGESDSIANAKEMLRMYRKPSKTQDDANNFRLFALKQILEHRGRHLGTDLTCNRSAETPARCSTEHTGAGSPPRKKAKTTVAMVQWGGEIQALFLQDEEGDLDLVSIRDCEITTSRAAPTVSLEEAQQHKVNDLKQRLRDGIAGVIGAEVKNLSEAGFKDVLGRISVESQSTLVQDLLNLTPGVNGPSLQDRADVTMGEAHPPRLNYRLEELVSFREFGAELDRLEERVGREKPIPDEGCEARLLRQLAGLWHAAKKLGKMDKKPQKKHFPYSLEARCAFLYEDQNWATEEQFNKQTTRINHIQALIVKFGYLEIRDKSGHFVPYNHGSIFTETSSPAFWTDVLTHSWMILVSGQDISGICGEQDDDEGEVSAKMTTD